MRIPVTLGDFGQKALGTVLFFRFPRVIEHRQGDTQLPSRAGIFYVGQCATTRIAGNVTDGRFDGQSTLLRKFASWTIMDQSVSDDHGD